MELVDVSGGYKPSDKGVGGHPDPEIRGGGLQKNCFRPFGSHFGRKIRGGGLASRAPLLDPPLDVKAYLHFFMSKVYLYCSNSINIL